MSNELPSIIVTGASGIVGRGFLNAAKDNYVIYAIARRSQKEAEIPDHPNIRWRQADISNWMSVRWVFHNIKREGGADYLLHLASYYDFNNDDHPEYERTNVKGTRYILEQAKIIGIKRFIFASSTAASKFPDPGSYINEKSPVNADYPYADAKKKGEAMVREFSQWFPCSIVRFAAVFTDWCEYGPLYMFLQTWLSKKWKSRVLGGRGESAIPYIHSNDLNKVIFKILKNSKNLPDIDVYIASPDCTTSHQELFDAATRFYFGYRIKPWFIPKFLALPGVIIMNFFGRLVNKRPFEQPWMIKYVDLKLSTDASYTRQQLNWEPTAHYSILRRLLFIIEKMKSDPSEWHKRNILALEKVSIRPNLVVYDKMLELKDQIIEEMKINLSSKLPKADFPNYSQKNSDGLEQDISIVYQLLSASVRNNDRMLLLNYIYDLIKLRFKEGFKPREICLTILELGKLVLSKLKEDPELAGMKQLLHDCVTLTFQLTVDEIQVRCEELTDSNYIGDTLVFSEIEKKIKELETY